MTTASSRFAFPFDKDLFAGFSPFADSAGSFARTAFETTSTSTRASVKGMQEMGQSIAAQMKDQMSLTVETGKKLSKADSLEDAMSIQTEYVKSAFEKNVKGFNELSDLYTDAFVETFAPLVKQAKKAAKASKSA